MEDTVVLASKEATPDATLIIDPDTIPVTDGSVTVVKSPGLLNERVTDPSAIGLAESVI